MTEERIREIIREEVERVYVLVINRVTDELSAAVQETFRRAEANARFEDLIAELRRRGDGRTP